MVEKKVQEERKKEKIVGDSSTTQLRDSNLALFGNHHQSKHGPSSDRGRKAGGRRPKTMQFGTLRILLVRHGLSEDNLNAIWAGHKDSPLSATGINQAKALGASLSTLPIDAIYSSDLKRARRTAEEILAANQSVPPPPLVQAQTFREQNFGQAEGRSWHDASEC